MKLTYRGAIYEALQLSVQSVETGQEGRFLGARYRVKQANVAFRRQPPNRLTYRGVSYSR
ncbi:MAG: DUF4278 domain-containing protein [Cyanobacteria bacterium J06627_15]